MNQLALVLFVAALIFAALDRRAREGAGRLLALARRILSKAKAMIDEETRRVQRKLFRRRWAYRHLFKDDKGELNQSAKVVLAHLTQFCRGLNTTTQVSPVTGVVDPIASAQAEGRREVLLMILRELNADIDTVVATVKEETVLGA